MDNYTLSYSLKEDSEKAKHRFKNKEEVLSFVKNLHRGIATIKWKPIYWISNFSLFQIWFTNYDIKASDNSYLDFHPWDDHPHTVSDEPGFYPRDEDVTNEILDECNFSFEGNNMEYKNNILRVYGEIFPIKKESKLDGLLNIFSNSEDKFMSYDDMKEVYRNWDFKEIMDKDFMYEWVRWILKYELSKIKQQLWLSENIFSLSVRWITKTL